MFYFVFTILLLPIIVTFRRFSRTRISVFVCVHRARRFVDVLHDVLNNLNYRPHYHIILSSLLRASENPSDASATIIITSIILLLNRRRGTRRCTSAENARTMCLSVRRRHSIVFPRNVARKTVLGNNSGRRRRRGSRFSWPTDRRHTEERPRLPGPAEMHKR